MTKAKTITRKVINKFTEAGLFWLSLAAPVFAQTPTNVPDDIINGANQAAPEGAPTNLVAVFRTITTTILFLVGAVAVVMLIFGGFRYVTSGGNQEQVTGAKNTIMYALIGLLISILAYAMVSFVFDRLQQTGDNAFLLNTFA